MLEQGMVTALIYRVVHDADTSYASDARVDLETDAFVVRVRDGLARFDLKVPFPDIPSARVVTDPYAFLWSASAAYTRRPGEFSLVFQGAVFEGPTESFEGARDRTSETTVRGSYPLPPIEPALSAMSRQLHDSRPAETVALSARATAKSSGGASLSVSPTQPLPLAKAIHLNGDAAVESGGEPPTTTISVDYNFGIETGTNVETPPQLSLKDAPTFRLPSDWELEKRELVARVEALERALREALPIVQQADRLRHGMGGNYPPIPLDDDADIPGNASDVVAGIRSIGDLRAQLSLPAPDDPVLVLISTWAIEKAAKATIATLRWLLGLANAAVKAAVVGAAGAAGAYLARPEEMAALSKQIADLLHSIAPEITKLF